jgi:hypothetical protein
MEEEDGENERKASGEATTALSHSATSMFVHTLSDRSIVPCQLLVARKWLLWLSFDLYINACRWQPRGLLLHMYGTSQISVLSQNSMRLILADQDTYSVDHRTPSRRS